MLHQLLLAAWQVDGVFVDEQLVAELWLDVIIRYLSLEVDLLSVDLAHWADEMDGPLFEEVPLHRYWFIVDENLLHVGID